MFWDFVVVGVSWEEDILKWITAYVYITSKPSKNMEYQSDLIADLNDMYCIHNVFVLENNKVFYFIRFFKLFIIFI